jgi:tRNA nucleotidyltransferase/poly(A) polymerase
MSNLKLNIPSDVIKIHKAFKKNGKKLYVVGGAIRDAILGKSPKDFDLATDAKPEEVEKIAKDNGISSKPIGKAFGVVSLFINKVEYEIATFRKDIGKGRRPTSVDYTDIQGDVKRRDLTVNALFYDIDKKEIVDLVGGIADLKKKNIRTVGKAKERFDEDPLRKLRALRFWTRLGGTLDKELLDALQNDPSIKGVSGERIRDEFLKSIKSSKNTKEYMEMNDKIGFTSQILPNLKISKPYPKTNDHILFLAWILRKNSPIVLSKILNKINYTKKEVLEIVYLITLQDFKPEKVLVYKNNQSKADDGRIITFGKMIGKDFKKLIKFKPSVKGGDVPKDIKGPQIGLWMANKEKENYLNEGLKELGVTDFKSLFQKMPSELQKRVYNLKNFGQRLDKHSEGNVLKHTIMVVNRSIKDDDIDIAIAAMFHDIGKDETAGIHPKKGHITHFGHEKVSATLAKKYRNWIESVGGNAANVFYIVKNHMKYKQLDNMTMKKVVKLKAFRAFDKLGKFSKHDRGGLDEGVNEFFYIDFKKYVYKNRKQINQKLKGLSYRKKVEFLELLWKKIVGKGFGKDADGRDIHYKLKSDKVIKEVDFPEDMPQDESKGRLRPADKLRRKRAMAGKKAAIQRKKKRTQKRKKPLDKLKKIAYKMAYLQVYKEFMEDLFPGMKKNELSIAQAKVVHKNVLRKKGRVMKRAKFRFLPALRDKEAQKFGTKESMDMLDQAFLKAKPIDKEIDETAKRDYKDEYKKFQSSTKAKKYRAELNKYNRDKGTYGNGDGKDASHKGGKIVGFESEKKNRGRAEKSRLKKK